MLKIILIITGVIIVMFNLLLVISACIVSSRVDRNFEEL